MVDFYRSALLRKTICCRIDGGTGSKGQGRDLTVFEVARKHDDLYSEVQRSGHRVQTDRLHLFAGPSPFPVVGQQSTSLAAEGLRSAAQSGLGSPRAAHAVGGARR